MRTAGALQCGEARCLPSFTSARASNHHHCQKVGGSATAWALQPKASDDGLCAGPQSRNRSFLDPQRPQVFLQKPPCVIQLWEHMPHACCTQPPTVSLLQSHRACHLKGTALVRVDDKTGIALPSSKHTCHVHSQARMLEACRQDNTRAEGLQSDRRMHKTWQLQDSGAS